MAIGGIGGFGGFDYKIYDIPQVDIETVKQQDEAAKRAEEALPVAETPEVSVPATETPDTRSRMANLQDISLTFNQGDDYSYIGSGFDIESLDIETAVSEMRRDKILEGYQYFVGPSQNLDSGFSSSDGNVFLKL